MRSESLEPCPVERIRIATRRSQLALAQSHWVKERLEALLPGLRVELREYVTRGDRIQDVPLAQVGGKGLFTKEIEEALLAGEADLAVHSLKDLPAELPPGLILAAVPPREDPRDALVLPTGAAPAEKGESGAETALALLPAGARIGSSSLRRSAQLRSARPDLRLENLRGNVDTRLRRLDEGRFDALILAAAGLRRLGLAHRIAALLPLSVSVPAPGQGALGLECRESDAPLRALLARLEDEDTRRAVTAERAAMDALGGGCSVPLGAHAFVERDDTAARLRLVAVLAAPDGSRLLRAEESGPCDDPGGLGAAVAARLLDAGARRLLEPPVRPDIR